MGHVNIPNIEDYRKTQLLVESLYTAECVESEMMKTRNGADMLRLRLRVVDGPAQEGGRNAIGTELSDFIVLDPSAARDSKGQEFMKRKIGQVFEAFGVAVDDNGDFDEHDFVGQTVVVKVKSGEDGDGFPTDTISRYKKFA